MLCIVITIKHLPPHPHPALSAWLSPSGGGNARLKDDILLVKVIISVLAFLKNASYETFLLFEIENSEDMSSCSFDKIPKFSLVFALVSGMMGP